MDVCQCHDGHIHTGLQGSNPHNPQREARAVAWIPGPSRPTRRRGGPEHAFRGKPAGRDVIFRKPRVQPASGGKSAWRTPIFHDMHVDGPFHRAIGGETGSGAPHRRGAGWRVASRRATRSGSDGASTAGARIGIIHSRTLPLTTAGNPPPPRAPTNAESDPRLGRPPQPSFVPGAGGRRGSTGGSRHPNDRSARAGRSARSDAGADGDACQARELADGSHRATVEPAVASRSRAPRPGASPPQR